MKKVKYITAEKVISDPIRGIIDIRPILPIIDRNYHFESLNYKYQLGMAYLIFPSATHTRSAHSFGAYKNTVRSSNRLVNMGMINKNEAAALNAFALLHDIGHFPFSHVSEVLSPINHKEHGTQIVREMKDEIEKAGVDFKLFMDLFEHKNPLHLIVSDKNLGTEKLDYLERDGFYTILSRPPGLPYLQHHTYFIDGNVVIDEKTIDEARDVQNFYVKMFKGVYLRKGSVIAQRMVQKIIYSTILSGDITVDELVKLNDFQLLSIFSRSNDGTVRYLYDSLMKRDLFKEAVAFRYDKFSTHGNSGGKPAETIKTDEEIMGKIISNAKLDERNQKTLEKLESNIASLCKLKKEEILVVPVTDPGRFRPKDIKILNSTGNITSLKKEYPAHFRDIEEIAKAYAAFRVCAQDRHRKTVAKKKNDIKKIILETIG